MNDLLDKVKNYRWWAILKALAFEGGPSSTKWVYLAMNAVMGSVVLMVCTSICWRYIRTGHVDPGMLYELGVLVTVLSGCATNAQNFRRKINAQVQTGDKPLADATTPITMQQPEETK